MPFGDRTGPLGQGPMTGRGLGYCSGYNQPGYGYPGWGRGWFGRGRGWSGRGRGWGRVDYGYPAWGDWGYYPPAQPTAKEEMQMLREEAEILRKELADIESTIQDLKTRKKK